MTRYIRSTAVEAANVDGEVFLVVPESDDVFYLDALSSGLWRALAAPHDASELATLYKIAFPDIDPDVIGGDIEAALAVLLRQALIRPAAG